MRKLFFTLFLCASFAVVASAQAGKAKKNVVIDTKANPASNKGVTPAASSSAASFSTAVSEMEAKQTSAKMKTVQTPVPAKRTATATKVKKA
jgi:hypothetical protein